MKLIVSTFLVYKVKKCLQKSGKVNYYDEPYVYCKKFSSLQEFDEQIKKLSDEEAKMRDADYHYNPNLFVDSFFKDWYSVLYHKNHKRCPVIIEHPELYKIMS